MDTLIGLATSALRSVRMAVELFGVGPGADGTRSASLQSAGEEEFIDFEALERSDRDLAQAKFEDWPVAFDLPDCDNNW